MGNIYHWVYSLGYIGYASRAKTWIFDADGDNDSNRDDGGGAMSSWLRGSLRDFIFCAKWLLGVRNPIPLLD